MEGEMKQKQVLISNQTML